jgi:hypothetical protein
LKTPSARNGSNAKPKVERNPANTGYAATPGGAGGAALS